MENLTLCAQTAGLVLVREAIVRSREDLSARSSHDKIATLWSNAALLSMAA